jgi:hypothetical protein
VGYANYTAPLLSQLKQETKREWAKEKQEVFLKLREYFESSIQLVDPKNERPYGLYTDASKLDISAILTQKSDSYETSTVFTAPRMLTETEKR